MTTKISYRKLALPLLLAALILAPPVMRGDMDEAQVEKMISYLESYYGPGVMQSRTFVGSEICLACHSDQAGWRTSMHATGFNTASNDAFSLQDKFGIVVDYDGNGVDDFKQGLNFNEISGPFDAFKPNAPILGYQDGQGYTITIGQLTYVVRFAYGGSGLYKQRYVVRIPLADGPGGLSRAHYVSPVQYNETVNQYTTYHPEDWWNEDGSPIYTPVSTMAEAGQRNRSFDRRCSGCHFTGLAVSRSPEGEWMATAPPAIVPGGSPHYYDMNDDGIAEEINTGCERCHGSGVAHILGRGDPEKIINPATDFTPSQANQLCASCHGRGTSKPDGVFGFPYDEVAQQGYQFGLGEELAERYWDSKPGQWPDGKHSTKHRQQGPEFEQSSKPTFQFRMVTCFECHDVHTDNVHHIRTMMVEEGSDGQPIEIATKVEDNTQCLACHATHGPFEALTPEDIADAEGNRDKIAGVVSAHTNHPYGPERLLGLSRCTTCHMPKVGKSAVAYDIASHTFEAIPPGKTVQYNAQGGMPNSCSACHRDLARLFGQPVDTSFTDWSEPADVAVAQWLETYFGPNGIWWATGSEGDGEATTTEQPAETPPAALRLAPARARSSQLTQR